MSAVICEERVTLPEIPKRNRPSGCAAFSSLRRCSSVADRCGYAPSSRLGETKDRQQRGMAEFFNRLLTAVKEKSDPGNNDYSDADIEPHQRAARRCLAATIGGAIK